MLLALLTLLAAPSPTIAPLTPAFEAESRGTMGVEFALPGGGGPTVGLTYFLNDHMALRMEFGLDAVVSPSGTPATFALGVGLRLYQFKRGGVALFLLPSVAFGRALVSPANAAEFIDLAGAVGVEYFFTDHLSAGGTLGLGLAFENLGGVTGSSVSTRISTRPSGLFASIYF